MSIVSKCYSVSGDMSHYKTLSQILFRSTLPVSFVHGHSILKYELACDLQLTCSSQWRAL